MNRRSYELATIAAALVFLVWFPDPLQTMIGGTELFLLIVGCDVVLGPLLSLVVYNSRKTRLALMVDYSVIGALQVSALFYGVFVLAGTRPVYVAFSLDRYEIVSAREISERELAAAREPRYRSLPWTGPRLVAVVIPQAEQQEALFDALDGLEEHQRPKFYVSQESVLAQIRKRAKPLAALTSKHPASAPLVAEAVSALDLPRDRLAWVPAHHGEEFWTAIVDTADGKPVAWVDFDPY